MKYIKTYEEFGQISNYVIYIGLFLDGISKKLLKDRFENKFDNIILDHITIEFKPILTSEYNL